MAYNDDAQVFERQIVIENTSQQAGVTSGSIVNKGTLSTLDTYITGHTIVNNVKITPNLNDIIYEQQATLANNQASFTNITDFFFDDSAATSFKAIINVTVSTGQAKYAVWEINGLYRPSGWVITSSFTGDITGVDFSIANQEGGIGQVQYKNSNTSGTTTIRYRATTTAPPGSTPIGVSGGVITNTSGPFLANNLIYANTDKTLATTDITYNSNLFTIGGSSRFIAEKATSFVSFSNGGAITSMGDASVAKRIIVGEKVGIATTAPSYALDVVGDINFTGTFYKNNNIYSGSEIWGTNGTSVFYTQGNIGFGTTTPSYQLDVSGSARVTSGFQADTILASTSISSGLLIATNATASNIVATTFSSGSVSATNISTTTITVGTLLANTITGGTLSLSGDLIVGGTLTTVNITTTNLTDVNISTGTLNASSSTISNVLFTNISSSTLISSNANITTLTAGSINASNATASNIVATTFSSGSVSATNIDSTSLTSGSILATTIVGSTSVSSGMLAATNATVTNIVATALTAGALKTSDISLNGNLVATGDITAFGNLSDRRLKTNIIDIDTESALTTVKSLRPVTFDWRDDIFNESKRGSHDVGFIAQEVEEVVPQAVAEYHEMNSGAIYKNIKHERLIPYLVGAIQTLQLRIEELEKKL
jgi:hypothetical protein